MIEHPREEFLDQDELTPLDQDFLLTKLDELRRRADWPRDTIMQSIFWLSDAVMGTSRKWVLKRIDLSTAHSAPLAPSRCVGVFWMTYTGVSNPQSALDVVNRVAEPRATCYFMLPLLEGTSVNGDGAE